MTAADPEQINGRSGLMLFDSYETRSDESLFSWDGNATWTARIRDACGSWKLHRLPYSSRSPLPWRYSAPRPAPSQWRLSSSRWWRISRRSTCGIPSGARGPLLRSSCSCRCCSCFPCRWCPYRRSVLARRSGAQRDQGTTFRYASLARIADSFYSVGPVLVSCCSTHRSSRGRTCPSTCLPSSLRSVATRAPG